MVVWLGTDYHIIETLGGSAPLIGRLKEIANLVAFPGSDRAARSKAANRSDDVMRAAALIERQAGVGG